MNLKESEKIAANLFNKYSLRPKKQVHSLHVALVAKFLGEELIKKRIKINLDNLYLAGLLHDIGDKAKNEDWNLDKHSSYGAELIRKEGFSEVAEIVRKHDVLAHDNADLTPRTWEEIILNYSDKVEKQTILSTNDRMNIFINEFPKEKERIIRCFDKVKKMEEKIFSRLPFKPEDLKKLVVLRDNLLV